MEALRYFKRNSLYLITCIILCTSIVTVYTIFEIPNKYDAQAIIQVSDDVSTYEKAVNSKETIDYVINRYNLRKEDVESSLSVTHTNRKITLRSRTTDAITSKKIIDSIIIYLTEKYPSINVISNASVATKPSAPNLVSNGVIGAIVGLVLGFVIKIVVDRGKYKKS